MKKIFTLLLASVALCSAQPVLRQSLTTNDVMVASNEVKRMMVDAPILRTPLLLNSVGSNSLTVTSAQGNVNWDSRTLRTNGTVRRRFNFGDDMGQTFSWQEDIDTNSIRVQRANTDTDYPLLISRTGFKWGSLGAMATNFGGFFVNDTNGIADPIFTFIEGRRVSGSSVPGTPDYSEGFIEWATGTDAFTKINAGDNNSLTLTGGATHVYGETTLYLSAGLAGPSNGVVGVSNSPFVVGLGTGRAMLSNNLGVTRFNTSNSEVSAIYQTTERVGIGTNAPGAKLDVNGAVVAAGFSSIAGGNARDPNGNLYVTNSTGIDAGAGAGSGDFVGPGSATDNAIVRFDGTTGKLGQNSSATVGDTGTLTAGHYLPLAHITYDLGTATAYYRTGYVSVLVVTNVDLRGSILGSGGPGLLQVDDARVNTNVTAQNVWVTNQVALLSTGGVAVVTKAAPSNSVTVTNLSGLVHQTAASVLEWNANVAHTWSVTNRIGAATTVVVTNTADGQLISGTIIGEASGGASRTVTVVPNTGQLAANLDDFSAALAASVAFTLTNGNAVEVSILVTRQNGTNIHKVATRQFKF